MLGKLAKRALRETLSSESVQILLRVLNSPDSALVVGRMPVITPEVYDP
jgi:hypothetical protein